MQIKLRQHLGVILEPSDSCFDSVASSFGCLFLEDGRYYLYYTGVSHQTREDMWDRSFIGIAESLDGKSFRKYSGNPVLDNGGQVTTPALFKAYGKYWMAHAFTPKNSPFRRIGIAMADDPLGEWKFVKELLIPEEWWEGNSIDMGPAVINMSETSHFVLYNNVTWPRMSRISHILKHHILRRGYIIRRLGILRINITSDLQIRALRYNKGPLSLNGMKGEWNESVFCPGYLESDEKHYLFPATSTYSCGYPYRQYIGLIEDTSYQFQHPTSKSVLIDGTKESANIVHGSEGTIGLDTPSAIVKNNELMLYYAVKDRYQNDAAWKMALSIFDISEV